MQVTFVSNYISQQGGRLYSFDIQCNSLGESEQQLLFTVYIVATIIVATLHALCNI